METLRDLKVADVMHDRLWDLPLVEENTPIKTVLIILTTRGYVWVVDTRKNMNITGVITEHDVLNFLDMLQRDMKADDLARKDVITCERQDSIAHIIEQIRTHNVRRLPVVEKGKLVGEITLRHLIEKVYSLLA